MRHIARFIAESLGDIRHRPGSGMRQWASSVRRRNAATTPPRSSPAQAAASARRSPSSSPAAAAGWSAATSTKPPRSTTADGIVAAGGEALATRCDVAQLDDVIQLAEGVAGLVRRPADRWWSTTPASVRAARPIGETEHRRLELGTRHQPVGPDSRLPCLRADPARGRVRRHHQRRLRRGIRCGTGDGGLQREQGRRAVAVGDARRRTVRHRRQVTVLCPTFVKTNIVDAGPASPTSRHSWPTG